MVHLNVNIKMAEMRINQAKLSKLTNIRVSTISTYYHDTWKTLPREHIEKLCKVFNCNVKDLITIDNEKDSDK